MNKLLIALALPLLSLAFSTNASAVDYPAKEKDSVYLYYALENKASPDELLESKDIALLLEEDKTLEEALPLSVRSSFIRRSELLPPEEFAIALRELTEKQASTLKKTKEVFEAVKNRSELGTVLLGNNLGTLEFQLVQVKGLQAMLNSLIPKTGDVAVKLEIKEQIEVLKDEQEKIEELIEEKDDRFSLLGWLVATI